MYSMIDSMLDYEEKNGTINVKDNIESLKALRETLEKNDVHTSQSLSIIA